MTDITLPLYKSKRFGHKTINGKEVDVYMGCEYEAIGFDTVNSIPRILFTNRTKWEKIFEEAFFKQPRSAWTVEKYKIPDTYSDDFEDWEGFLTSFIWTPMPGKPIKFRNVFVKLDLGKTYYLPISLIKQVETKLLIKQAKLDPSKFNVDADNTTWKTAKSSSKNVYEQSVDFIGEYNK